MSDFATKDGTSKNLKEVLRLSKFQEDTSSLGPPPLADAAKDSLPKG